MFLEINHILLNPDNVFVIEIIDSINAEEIENGYPYRVVAWDSSIDRCRCVELSKGSMKTCEEVMKQIKSKNLLISLRDNSFPVMVRENTPEQEARNMLERLGIEDAQRFTMENKGVQQFRCL